MKKYVSVMILSTLLLSFGIACSAKVIQDTTTNISTPETGTTTNTSTATTVATVATGTTTATTATTATTSPASLPARGKGSDRWRPWDQQCGHFGDSPQVH